MYKVPQVFLTANILGYTLHCNCNNLVLFSPVLNQEMDLYLQGNILIHRHSHYNKDCKNSQQYNIF